MRPGSPLSDGLLDCSHTVWTHSLELVSIGEFGCVHMGGVCLSRMPGASLFLCNVVNRAKSDVQVGLVTMPICNIGIHRTCTSD